MRRIRYTLFCINWMWKHRTWENTRQKWKRMEKDYRNRFVNVELWYPGTFKKKIDEVGKSQMTELNCTTCVWASSETCKVCKQKKEDDQNDTQRSN